MSPEEQFGCRSIKVTDVKETISFTEVHMLLSELLCGVNITGVFASRKRMTADALIPGLHVTGIATDSSKVCPGDVFICLKGSHTDGHLYAGEAVRRGAAAVVASRPLMIGAPVITVENTRRAAAFMWNNRYGTPARGMTVTAVTGTNGKTSVAYMIREILTAAGFKCGLIGTVKCLAGDTELRFGGGSEIAGAAAAMTTPDPEYLYRMLYEMRLCGVTHVVMEASSHALSQHKLDPLAADVAVFTGLSPEHLDYHGTMDNYLSAKSVLFRSCGKGIINADDPYAERLCDAVQFDRVTVSAEDLSADVSCENVAGNAGEVSYTLISPKGRTSVTCPMPGKFGLYNSLLAAAAAMEAGVSTVSVREGLRRFSGVPGRMETVARFGELRVIRDYAHTPDALRGALQIASGETKGRLWLLFGCGGDRDRAKRPEMGRIAAETADFTVITSDNPRSENRDSIIADIMKGFDKTKPHTVIPDRKEAIRYAVLNADAGDTVLLCGKGHETYEITAEGMRPFDEAAIARSAMEERRHRSD